MKDKNLSDYLMKLKIIKISLGNYNFFYSCTFCAIYNTFIKSGAWKLSQKAKSLSINPEYFSFASLLSVRMKQHAVTSSSEDHWHRHTAINYGATRRSEKEKREYTRKT